MAEKEEWKPMKLEGLDPEDKFLISTLGNIKKYNKSKDEYQPAKVNKVSGYATFYVKLKNGKRTIRYVHRAMASTFLEKDNDYQHAVIHKDYDKLNNRLENISWADRNEQMIHQKDNPNIVHKGRKHGYKLKPEDVKELFRLANNEEMTKAELSRKFGVSPTQIRRILRRQNWDDVEIDD